MYHKAPKEPWITPTKLNVIEKRLDYETQKRTTLNFTSFGNFTCLPPKQIEWNLTNMPLHLVCKFVNRTTVFMLQKLCITNIDCGATFISGKLFERYDHDEYQKWRANGKKKHADPFVLIQYPSRKMANKSTSSILFRSSKQ